MLLDTHAFLWFVQNDPNLSRPALEAISDRDKEVRLSPASYWEIGIKVQLGKYRLNMPLAGFIEKAIELYGFTILPIEPRHAEMVAKLPRHHRDPFDRLLIAQAMVEGLTVISADAAMDAYPITRLW